MKKIFLIILTVIVINLISVPNIGQWIYWDDIQNIPSEVTNFVNPDGSGDFTTIQAAIDNAESVAFANSKSIIHVSPGTYTEDLVITNIKYLKIEMAGVIIDGTVTFTTTQQGGDYYSKIEFVGGESNRPEKGDNGQITGNITGTRNNDSLIYLSFTGMELSGDLGFSTNGTWVVFMNHAYMNSSTSHLYGDFDDVGSPCVLLETMGKTRIKAHIADPTADGVTEVALYDVSETEFDLINIDSDFGGIIRNCTFKSDVTLTDQTWEIDNFSYGEIVRQTEDLSGATITYMDNYNGGDVTVVGTLTAGSISGISTDKFEDADGDTYGQAVEDSIKLYVKDVLAMYIDSLYITLVKDMQAQFPIEMLEDQITVLANTDYDSAVDGVILGSRIDVDDVPAMQAIGESNGSGVINRRIAGSTTKFITVNDSTYTLNETYNWDEIILHVTTSDTVACTITIDTDMLGNNTKITVKDADFNAGSNTITIATEGAETIDENATDTLSVNGESKNYYTDGSNWFIY